MAALAPAREARRKYRWAQVTGLDPLLVLRLGPGRHLLRAFPVSAEAETVVTIEGIALTPPERRSGTRLYRTGERILAVRDLRGQPEGGEFADEEGRRALRFLSLAEAQERFGAAMERVVDVSFVPAIESALTGKGTAAPSDECALGALPKNAAMPPEPEAPRPPE